MPGTRGTNSTDGLDEIYIVSPDSSTNGSDGEFSNANRPGSSRRPMVTGRQAALLLVVGVLTFAVGVGVGSHRGGSGVAQDAPTAAAATVGDSAAGPNGVGPQRGSDASSAPASSNTAAAPIATSAPGTSGAGTSSVAREPWPTATGLCGYQQPVALISDTLPLNGATGLTVLAGGAPGPVAVDGGAGEALFSMSVNELAEDSAGLVAIATPDPCAPYSPEAAAFAFRIGDDGVPRQIFPDAGAAPAPLAVWGLVSGGDRAYLAASAMADTASSEGSAADDTEANTVTLIATDGSGASGPLPAGFQPAAGWRHLIVGSYVSPVADTNGPVQIYDLVTGGIVTQLAASSPQIVAAGSHLVWLDASCQVRCTVRTYEMDTGQRTDVPVTLLRSDYAGIGTVAALSPDGDRLAMVTYDADPVERYELGHPGGPARFSVLDLTSGELTRLPGVVRAPKSQFGAAFSPDGQWLAVAVNDGAHTRVLLYDHDLRGPYDPGISVPASTAWRIPLVIEQP